jgi:hypothetical protein
LTFGGFVHLVLPAGSRADTKKKTGKMAKKVYKGKEALEKLSEIGNLETPMFPFKAGKIQYLNLSNKSDIPKYGRYRFEKHEIDLIGKTVGFPLTISKLKAFLAKNCNVQNPQEYSWPDIFAALKQVQKQTPKRIRPEEQPFDRAVKRVWIGENTPLGRLKSLRFSFGDAPITRAMNRFLDDSTSIKECIVLLREFLLSYLEQSRFDHQGKQYPSPPNESWCDSIHIVIKRRLVELRRKSNVYLPPVPTDLLGLEDWLTDVERALVKATTEPENAGDTTQATPETKQKTKSVRDLVFIGYSHKDKKWLDDLQTHLKPYVRNGSVTAWSDKQIAPGSKWFPEIKAALASTKVAVLLVTPYFLASDFIHEHELGPLLKETENGKVSILWIPVRACSYKETPLKDYQAAGDPEKPLEIMKANRNKAWVKICEEIKKTVSSSLA